VTEGTPSPVTMTVVIEREMFWTMYVVPVGRSAGMVATEGCEVTPGGRADCAVTTEGSPVTTPRELVMVRYDVAALE